MSIKISRERRMSIRLTKIKGSVNITLFLSFTKGSHYGS